MGKVNFLNRLAGAATAAVILTAWTAAAQDVTDTVRALFRVDAPSAASVKAAITPANGSACTGDSAAVTPKASASARDTLTLLIGPDPSSVLRGQQRQDAPALVSYSRGSVTLTLRQQQYGGASVSLYTVNGRRVLHNKISAASGAHSVSRSNLPAGAYMLSVKGANGSTFAAKLAHSGGKLNINVAFGGEDFSLGKQAAEHCGVWTLALSAAAGYHDTTHTFNISAAAVTAGVIDIGTVALRALPTYSLTVNRDPPSGGTVERSINQTSYTHGTTVTLTARPESGYRFFGWSGALDITDTAITVTMDRDLTLTAIFVPAAPPPVKTYTVTFNTDGGTPGAIAAITVDSGTAAGAKFPANPTKAGYIFDGWFEGSTLYTSTKVILKDVTLIAGWTPEAPDPTQNIYTLKASASPAAGGTVTPNDTSINHGATVTVKAVANAGYRFTGWSGGSTSTSAELPVTMTGNVTLTANFEILKYTLNVSASPSIGGKVTVAPAGETTYNHGTTVTVKAVAEPGYKFISWSGGSTSTVAELPITMTGNVTLVANFEIIKYTLTTTANPPNGGIISPSGQTTHNHGTTVTVTASPANGYKFDSWTGASSSSNEVKIIMTKDESVIANFVQTFAVMVNGGTGSGTYAMGETVPIEAAVPSGHVFVNWTVVTPAGLTLVGANNAKTTFTMPASAVTVTANFSKACGGKAYDDSKQLCDGRDNKLYNYVKIGTQTWMAENLNYDTLDGTGSWRYNNSADSCAKYGRLYNWSTVMNGASSSSTNPSGRVGICPSGWHVPSDAEWTQLTDFVGGSSTAGTKLKSSTGWQSYSGVPAGTNQYGFSALPGGDGYGSSFSTAGYNGFWWSATEYDASYAWYRYLGYNDENVYRGNNDKSYLFSVRCVKD